MTKKISYSDNEFPNNKLSVGIDFSRANVINEPKSRIKEKPKEAELVSFSRTDKITKPLRTRITCGSYTSRRSLEKILQKRKGDKSIYPIIDSVRKNNKKMRQLREDFRLLRDFFPRTIILEVEDYVERILPKVLEILKAKEGEERITPRKRRGIILAVFRSFARRFGRKLTPEVIEEANKRFNYKRTISPFEVATWENFLIKNKLLKRPEKRSKTRLKTFFLHIINHTQKLLQETSIAKNDEYSNILQQAKKTIMGYASKKKQEKLNEIIKHKDLDFAARLTIWTLCKFFAKNNKQNDLQMPQELPGWKKLFLADLYQKDEEKQEIPVRTWKYINWSEFSLQKELKEYKLFPEGKN